MTQVNPALQQISLQLKDIRLCNSDHDLPTSRMPRQARSKVYQAFTLLLRIRVYFVILV